MTTAGCTDRYLVCEVLRRSGKSVDLFDAIAARSVELSRPAYQADPDGPSWVLPGSHELLRALEDVGVAFGLVTGNVPEIAEAKLRYGGLWSYFERQSPLIHGYGDISEDRNDLARAAAAANLQRCPSGWDPFHTWVIGDTPSDIACARAIEARVLAVATGNFSVEELRRHQPDLVVDSLLGITLDDLV